MTIEYKAKKVENLTQANKVWEMFCIPNIIGVLSEGEKQRFKENIKATIINPKGVFLYIESEERKVIGATGAWENYIQNGGFVIEHFAVIEEMRGKGLGKFIFYEAEKFISQFNPRYITIETGDNSFYDPGRKLYEKFGYIQVSHFPKYYDPTSGRIDYMKNF